MIDFVHLNWLSYSHKKPEGADVYLLLVKDKGELSIKSRICVDGEVIGPAGDEVIAWADPKKIAFDRFDCAPEKYHPCNSAECPFSNDCSTCHLTTKLEDAKWGDWFL